MQPPLSPCPLLTLPEELLELILEMSVYDGDELSRSKIEYNDITRRGAPFALRHSGFAEDILTVNHQLHRLGLPVLWRFVVVRSMSSLQSIARTVRNEVSATGRPLPSVTRRLQLRICGDYDSDMLRDVISAMTQLEVLLVINRPDVNAYYNADPLSSIVSAISTTSLRRVQFDSSPARPSLHDIAAVLRLNPHLKTLRCGSISTDSSFPSHAHLLDRPMPGLTALSVGLAQADTSLANMPLALVMAANDSVHEEAFPSLTQIHLMEYDPRVEVFFHTYGPRLRRLLYSTPPKRAFATPSTNFLSSCPNLHSLVWVVSSWCCLSSAHEIPPSHAHIRTIMAVCSDRQWQSRDCIPGVQRFLDTLETGAFPKMKTLVLQLGTGAYVSELEAQTWFRARRRSLARRNIQIRMYSDLHRYLSLRI